MQVWQSGVLENSVRSLLFSQACPWLLKRELLVILCNSLRRKGSYDFLAYLINKCDVIKAISDSLKIAVQEQHAEKKKDRI